MDLNFTIVVPGIIVVVLIAIPVKVLVMRTTWVEICCIYCCLTFRWCLIKQIKVMEDPTKNILVYFTFFTVTVYLRGSGLKDFESSQLVLNKIILVRLLVSSPWYLKYDQHHLNSSSRRPICLNFRLIKFSQFLQRLIYCFSLLSTRGYTWKGQTRTVNREGSVD